MNVFYLSENPKECAEQHCDKHVVKMIIEYAQLMSTAHRILDGTEYEDRTANSRRIRRWRMGGNYKEALLYKASHINHPSAIWLDLQVVITFTYTNCFVHCVTNIRIDMVKSTKQIHS